MDDGTAPGPAPAQASGGVFATTHWSVVLAAGQVDSPEAEAALETLCRAYWYPIYGFVRRAGHGHAQAQDLTQEFFFRLLARNDFARAKRDRGPFRAYLLGALRHFLADAWDKASARKRGGAFQFVALEEATAEERQRLEPPAISDPERLYDRRWALTLLNRVLQRLRDEYRAAGKESLFAVLEPLLTQAKADVTGGAAAQRLGLSEGATRVALHRLRQRYGRIFREEIAHTVARPEEIEDEIRHLLAALGE